MEVVLLTSGETRSISCRLAFTLAVLFAYQTIVRRAMLSATVATRPRSEYDRFR